MGDVISGCDTVKMSERRAKTRFYPMFRTGVENMNTLPLVGLQSMRSAEVCRS